MSKSEHMADFDSERIYNPLPTTTSIRLLEILERRDTGEIRCSLEPVDLDDRPIYNCLSYIWGDPNPAYHSTQSTAPEYETQWPIELNVQLFFVRQNLYDALNMLWDERSAITEQPDPISQTRLLHAVASKQDMDVVRHLLHNGADITAKSDQGKTPLDFAMAYEEKGYARLLLQAELERCEGLSAHTNKSAIQLEHESIIRNLSAACLRGVDENVDHQEPVRRPGTKQNFVWIDAVCINQGDILERNSQVNMMGRIFRDAQSIVAWLGPDAPYA